MEIAVQGVHTLNVSREGSAATMASRHRQSAPGVLVGMQRHLSRLISFISLDTWSTSTSAPFRMPLWKSDCGGPAPAPPASHPTPRAAPPPGPLRQSMPANQVARTTAATHRTAYREASCKRCRGRSAAASDEALHVAEGAAVAQWGAAPAKGISTTSAPLGTGGRSAMASRTVTARRGRPGAAGTAVYATCTAPPPLTLLHASPLPERRQ